MKICVDCKYYYRSAETHPIGGFVILIDSCTRISKINMVTGNTIKPYLNCTTEREDAQRLEKERCGHDGRYFVKKIEDYLDCSKKATK